MVTFLVLGAEMLSFVPFPYYSCIIRVPSLYSILNEANYHFTPHNAFGNDSLGGVFSAPDQNTHHFFSNLPQFVEAREVVCHILLTSEPIRTVALQTK